MTNLNQRLMRLEGARAVADIKAMSDEALDAHIRTLTFGTAECYAAIVARVLRHPSVFPVVRDESDSLQLVVAALGKTAVAIT